jgi:hypothetical protein
MSGHSHEEHNFAEQKPVSFTVPFILAAVTLLILFLFLSLCDPKSHHGAGHSEHNAAATEHHDMNAAPEHEATAPAAVETDEHTAEATVVDTASHATAHH